MQQGRVIDHTTRSVLQSAAAAANHGGLQWTHCLSTVLAYELREALCSKAHWILQLLLVLSPVCHPPSCKGTKVQRRPSLQPPASIHGS